MRESPPPRKNMRMYTIPIVRQINSANFTRIYEKKSLSLPDASPDFGMGKNTDKTGWTK